jgi:hypothetical protein
LRDVADFSVGVGETVGDQPQKRRILRLDALPGRDGGGIVSALCLDIAQQRFNS